MRKKTFRKYEITGVIVACILAPVFHFTYAWSGDSVAVGIFSAVNESVWEHTKIIYFPMLFYSIVEYFLVRPDFWRFFCAKAVSLGFASAAMIAFFYTYTGIFGTESLGVDIVCTFVWIILAFVISYRLYYSGYDMERYKALFVLLFCGQLAIQILFTPFAADIGLPLFMDSETGGFGFAA
jgi:hypothetical protein